MTKPFVYDEKTSSLYSPDGEFIKKIDCPKAVHWNQLLVDEIDDSSRGCTHCDDRVLNLDITPPKDALAKLKSHPNTCVYATSNSCHVISLIDDKNPENPKIRSRLHGRFANEYRHDLPLINTVRNFEDMQRAIKLGFWVDIRLVRPNIEDLSQRLDISQNMKTGEVQLTKFHRGRKILDLDWVEIINDVSYYPYYQEMPIAAYLIPKNLPNESEVFIPDPIEDFKLTNFPLSDNRANNLIGVVLNKKVILKPHQTKIIEWVG